MIGNGRIYSVSELGMFMVDATKIINYTANLSILL
jgi:hypothetical protein